jgi:hypothetical protein
METLLVQNLSFKRQATHTKFRNKESLIKPPKQIDAISKMSIGSKAEISKLGSHYPKGRNKNSHLRPNGLKTAHDLKEERKFSMRVIDLQTKEPSRHRSSVAHSRKGKSKYSPPHKGSDDYTS